MYEPALRVAGEVRRARGVVADFLGGVEGSEVLFTSCATESNNTAIFGVAAANPGRRHILTSAVEHPAVLEVCREMGRRGYEVTVLPVDGRGQIATGDYVRALRPDTLLVSLRHANNAPGGVWPVGEWARIAKETDAGIVFHTDATQTAGKLGLDLRGVAGWICFRFRGIRCMRRRGGVLFVRRGCDASVFVGGASGGGAAGGDG